MTAEPTIGHVVDYAATAAREEWVHIGGMSLRWGATFDISSEDPRDWKCIDEADWYRAERQAHGGESNVAQHP